MLRKILGLENSSESTDPLAKELEDKTYKLSLLLEYSRVLVGSDVDKIVSLLLSGVSAVTKIPDVSLSFIYKGKLKLISHLGDIDEKTFYEHYQDTPLWHSCLSGEPYLGRFIGPLPVTGCFPLVLREEIFGVLAFHSNDKEILHNDIDFVQTLVDFVSLALKNAWNYKRAVFEAKTYKSKAIHDQLTQLYNRQFLQEVMDKEMSESKRHNVPLSLIIFDIDHFKRFNDNYGHQFGDIVIKGVAERAKQSLRVGDFAFRYGGEEFLLVLPHAAIQEAVKVADRVRHTVETHVFSNGEGITAHVTVSLGVAQWQSDEHLKSLIERADKALYRSKAEGRNRVSVWDKRKDGGQ